ncbi:glycosidase [Sphingobacterium sp. UT-1RO-CII-1]|uniref:glycoside hydrolase family 130 protein n=1 Tax=Sphingobacterium sp. UT-1RO-CII-1 TaxID=2995225 RepID=UPI00227A2F45|nr:glycosidase [Sphingobacterium sp. UT-1RO-CII-1]MCY4778425.1 glycosidase [Sphingobacterium sp. UT-1RO-CII-1]
MSIQFERTKNFIFEQQQALLTRVNTALPSSNGILQRYSNPVVTKYHIPLDWRFDFNPSDNPFFMERISYNSTMNAGALYWEDRFLLFVRVEGVDRKSFFAVAESPNGIDNFKFWDRPLLIPDIDPNETNIYDIRLTAHEDGWVYGIFCSEQLAPSAASGDLSTAIANSGIVRSKDLLIWERLPNIKSSSQQRNVVLHPEYVDGKYALYTRPQDDFIYAQKGGGIGWTLIDDICNPVVLEEEIINPRNYHTIKEVKNGEGPPPIKTEKGWLHLAHGVRNTAAGLRYVLYLYVTSIDQPNVVIAEPAGYFMAPEGDELVGDVSNVLFSNGWILNDNKVYIYYASSDTRMHVASSTLEQLLDYCFGTATDDLRSVESVRKINTLIEKNRHYINEEHK